MSKFNLFQNQALQKSAPIGSGFNTELISLERLEKDRIDLKQITVEIKAIEKQGIILMGERVHRASDLLKPYKEG